MVEGKKRNINIRQKTGKGEIKLLLLAREKIVFVDNPKWFTKNNNNNNKNHKN